MAQKVLIMGESGTGKSTSMRNCNPATIAVVNPVGKPLPFKNHFETLSNETDARKITRYMKEQAAAGKKIIVVDDFQYILAVPYMNRIKETGWDKYNDFGSNYFEIIEVCKDLPDDVVVVYMTHLETLDNGLTTVKLIGKLLREKITIEGLFTVVLRTGVSEAKYYFYTQNSGKDTVKSPLGMFPAYAIDNDLAWGGIVGANEIIVDLSAHKTTDNIIINKAFTVGVADLEHLVACDYVGIVSANKEADKMQKAGFTTTKSEYVNAPVINELPLTLECELVKVIDGSKYLAEIKNVSADEKYLGDDGEIDLSKFTPITYDPVHHGYYRLGERVGNAFKDGAKLK